MWLKRSTSPACAFSIMIPSGPAGSRSRPASSAGRLSRAARGSAPASGAPAACRSTCPRACRRRRPTSAQSRDPSPGTARCTSASRACSSRNATPQTAVWHFGWNTPDPRKYNERFRAMGLEIAQMWDAADGKLVDMSSDTLPGLPTQEQILELRAKGVQPTRQGGFGYLRGPDGALIENAQAGQVERFNHIHMYHEHPLCAMQWYVTHLGATLPAGPGGAPTAAFPAECKQPYAPPTWPSFAKFPGFVRDPSGAVFFDDISISIRPWPGGGLVSTRGHLVDHWALSVADLEPAVTRLKSEGVKFLEEIHPWGNTRAAMIEGPDRVAIELVEVKQP